MSKRALHDKTAETFVAPRRERKTGRNTYLLGAILFPLLTVGVYLAYGGYARLAMEPIGCDRSQEATVPKEAVDRHDFTHVTEATVSEDEVTVAPPKEIPTYSRDELVFTENELSAGSRPTVLHWLSTSEEHHRDWRSFHEKVARIREAPGQVLGHFDQVERQLYADFLAASIDDIPDHARFDTIWPERDWAGQIAGWSFLRQRVDFTSIQQCDLLLIFFSERRKGFPYDYGISITSPQPWIRRVRIPLFSNTEGRCEDGKKLEYPFYVGEVSYYIDRLRLTDFAFNLPNDMGGDKAAQRIDDFIENQWVWSRADYGIEGVEERLEEVVRPIIDRVITENDMQPSRDELLALVPRDKPSFGEVMDVVHVPARMLAEALGEGMASQTAKAVGEAFGGNRYRRRCRR